ncbi:MAG: hypothetical protein LBS26_00695 [Campylobacteraceae bacterium]|jgi:hypothetical protein|nr:hypothetical protein [Campylobacteraceae bacterium]
MTKEVYVIPATERQALAESTYREGIRESKTSEALLRKQNVSLKTSEALSACRNVSLKAH